VNGVLHKNGEAERFYRELKQQGMSVRVGMEGETSALLMG